MVILRFPQGGHEWKPADSFPISSELTVRVFPDRAGLDEWRVEYEDHDGSCYVVVFPGADAERRARDYFAALKSSAIPLFG